MVSSFRITIPSVLTFLWADENPGRKDDMRPLHPFSPVPGLQTAAQTSLPYFLWRRPGGFFRISLLFRFFAPYVIESHRFSENLRDSMRHCSSLFFVLCIPILALRFPRHEGYSVLTSYKTARRLPKEVKALLFRRSHGVKKRFLLL